MENFDLKKYLAEGKITENEDFDTNAEEYDTDGYVEAMGPELFDHVDAIVKIFQNWKDGPMTEPEMVGYATYDLIKYITGELKKA